MYFCFLLNKKCLKKIDGGKRKLKKILLVSGTNRPNSVTRKIADIYSQLLANKNIDSEILDLAHLPEDFVFSALYHNSGKNNSFNQLVEKMKLAEKYVFIVPEYNNSFPGVLKAFIDGMPYPNSFVGKKCALVGLSSGMQGSGLALSHLTDVFNYLGMHVLANKPKLAKIEQNFKDGQITNDLYWKLLNEQMEQIIEF